jgi:hypothetical protein
MEYREPTPKTAHDLLLVVGVAAVVLGVVMVGGGVLPSPSAAHRVLPTHAAPGRLERLVPAPKERPVAIAPPADRVPITSAPRTARCGTNTHRHTWACAPRHDLDHDLRLVLATMALQRRRTLHPTAGFVAPDKQEIAASVLARVKRSGATPEAWPPAVRRLMGPDH